MKIRLTAPVRRGLRQLYALVEADVDADAAAEQSRWTKQERAEVHRALDYLRQIAYRTP